ncbi:hypothetical protein C8Q75DRAFT_807408 [Abortiporus biennis]|nr:hypothetical protein C8Q75DRAFT_807408 [Abortiporus biennis]
MATLPPLPNPLTPFAWLPPDIANQLEAARCLYSATLGAWVWDLLMSMHEDWRVFSKGSLRLPGVVYILARMASLSFILTAFIFAVGYVDNCHALAKTIGWCGAAAMPLNSLLFFFRVKAVFNNNPIVVVLFGILWLATLGCISAPFAVDGTSIGTTRSCVSTSVQSYSSAGIIIVAVHDTLVFFAITIKLTMSSLADSWTQQLRTFFSGRGMGKMSRTLLMSGQLYYLATVGLNIVAMAVILAPSVPPVIAAMFSIPNVALQNAMACRVYRQLKLGLIREVVTEVSASSRNNKTSIIPRFHQTSKTQPEFDQSDSESRVRTVHVEIDTKTEVAFDPLTNGHAESFELKHL